MLPMWLMLLQIVAPTNLRIVGLSGTPALANLPVAVAQSPNTTAYNGFNVASRPSGYSYLDPTTGVRVWKVTDSTTPRSNSTMTHYYGPGPVMISREWDGNKHTLLLFSTSGAHWLVDFQRGVGFSNWRELTGPAQPNMDLAASFGKARGNERILFILNGSQLKRYNTATNQIEDTGNFPLSVGDLGNGSWHWLTSDKDDRWFGFFLISTNKVVAWNSATGERLTANRSGIDFEIRIGTDGDYAILTYSTGGEAGYQVWNLATNSFHPFHERYWGAGTPVAPHAHGDALRGGRFATADWDCAEFPDCVSLYYVDANNDSRVGIPNGPHQDNSSDFHASGQWVQDSDDLSQYVLYYSIRPSAPIGGINNRGLVYLRLDGADSRLLCHHYSHDNLGNGYWDLPFPTQSPDGKLVMFNSNMNVPSGRSDVFVVEVPLQ